jgi:hypothetical protein
MKKKITLILLILAVLSSILFINLGNKSTAQECNDCTLIPTPPGDSNYSKINCNCVGTIPTIKASTSEIKSGSSITLWVDSGGKACPDFTWSVSNAKYTLNKSKTVNDLETVTMTAASGTCSSTGYDNSSIYVIVNVTDSCKQTNQIIIRNTAGKWGTYSTHLCGYNNLGPAIYGDPQGKYSYRIGYGSNCSCSPSAHSSCSQSSCVIDILDNQASYGFPNTLGQYIYCVSSSNQPYCGDPSCRGQMSKLAIITIPNSKDHDGYIKILNGSPEIGIDRATWVCQ